MRNKTSQVNRQTDYPVILIKYTTLQKIKILLNERNHATLVYVQNLQLLHNSNF